MKKALTYGAGLIAVYLVVAHGTGAKTVISSGASGAVSTIKALQGR